MHCFTERCMNQDERMSDTLSKWERISKGASTREMKLVFKVTIWKQYARIKFQTDGLVH